MASPETSFAPHSLEAELSVIGAILTTPSAAVDHASKLQAEYFFIESHKIIIACIQELTLENIPPDIISVYERLKFKGQNNNVGDFDGLQGFLQYSTHAENVGYWIDQVKNYWELRTVVEKCSEIAQRGKRIVGASIPEFLQEAEQVFMRLAEERVSSGLIPVSEIVRDTILDLESLFSQAGTTTGVPSGFTDLDKITAGFQPSDLIIIAGRPAMGKTSLAMNIASHAAIQGKKYVAFFSLEMSKKQLMQRLLSMSAKVHSHKFRDGRMTPEELNRLYPEVANFQTDTLLIDDTPGISILEMASRCRKLKRERGACDLIIIDYLQLLRAGHSSQNINREREVAMISSGLKNLARELSCPVIALAQLSRSLEARTDKRPKQADLRESGSLEQDADQILMVYRDEVYNKASEDRGIAEVIIEKNRHGSQGTIKLHFQNEFTAFYNLAKPQI